MTSYILKTGIALLFIVGFFVHIPYVVHANETQILSVTPPLFQVAARPGDVWQSSVKIVNSNSYPLTVYPEIVNFKASGEGGQGVFSPIIEHDEDKATLAEWIVMNREPLTISPEQSAEIPFVVEVPDNAPPGGHYAAILITTQPPQDKTEKMLVQTSQAVTSLFFVRVEGDVQEIGDIREFTVLDSILPRPEAEFSLRFENKGNVHLQPRGDILITNMWGTERGTIPVNYQTHFGNVLPNSIRDFKFSWKSDFKITDIGRYKAIATLAYGEDGIKSTSATTYFWVIPIKITLITLGVLALFIWLIVIMVRAYVRRVLALAGVRVDSDTQEKNPVSKTQLSVPPKTYRTVSAPIRNGVLDLRQRLSTADESMSSMKTVLTFIVSYKWFFISLCALIFIFITTVVYIDRATEENKNYQVIIDTGEGKTTLDGNDIQ